MAVAIQSVASVPGFMISLISYLVIFLTDHPTADHMLLFCEEVTSVMLYLEYTADAICLNLSFLIYNSDI
jgi:hypothetical protein